jgi:hypothetical protein
MDSDPGPNIGKDDGMNDSTNKINGVEDLSKTKEESNSKLDTSSCDIDGPPANMDTNQKVIQPSQKQDTKQCDGHVTGENNAGNMDTKTTNNDIGPDVQVRQDMMDITNQSNDIDLNTKGNDKHADPTQSILDENNQDPQEPYNKEKNSIDTIQLPNSDKQSADAEATSFEAHTKDPEELTSERDPDAASERESVDLEILQRVLEGWCPYSKLPPQSKKIVRIFVSSTFSG